MARRGFMVQWKGARSMKNFVTGSHLLTEGETMCVPPSKGSANWVEVTGDWRCAERPIAAIVQRSCSEDLERGKEG